MLEPVLYETHMHTPLCRHASGEPEAYAEIAIERGLAGIIVTCHNTMPGGYGQGSGRYAEEVTAAGGLVGRAGEELIDHIAVCLDQIEATGVAMRMNTSGLNKTIAEMNPGRSILSRMQARGIPVVIGADAHVPERVGERFGAALEMLAEVGYRRV